MVRSGIWARIAHHVEPWPLGDPLDPETRLGALISERHCAKATGYLEQAEHVLIGGTAKDGFVEAISLANDTEYGLCASLFTANAKRAVRGAPMLRSGMKATARDLKRAERVMHEKFEARFPPFSKMRMAYG